MHFDFNMCLICGGRDPIEPAGKRSDRQQLWVQRDVNFGNRSTNGWRHQTYYVLSAKSISTPQRITIQKRDHKLLEEFRVHFPRCIQDVGNNGDGNNKAKQCIFHRSITCNSRECLRPARRPELSPDSEGYCSSNENHYRRF